MFFLHFFVCMFLLFRHVLFAHSHGIPFEQTSLFFIWDPKSFCLFSCSNVIPDPMKLLMLIFSYAPAELIPVSAKIHSFYESLCLASQRQRLLFSPRFDVFSSWFSHVFSSPKECFFTGTGIISFVGFWGSRSLYWSQLVFAPEVDEEILQRLWTVWPVTHSVLQGEDRTQDLPLPSPYALTTELSGPLFTGTGIMHA